MKISFISLCSLRITVQVIYDIYQLFELVVVSIHELPHSIGRLHLMIFLNYVVSGSVQTCQINAVATISS